MPKLYKVPEVAAVLRVKPPTVYDWIKNKKLNAIRAGRLIRVSEEQLADFINQRFEVKKTLLSVQDASIRVCSVGAKSGITTSCLMACATRERPASAKRAMPSMPSLP